MTTPTPIHHHSILSDQRTIAVANTSGDIVWLCLPRLDSPALFSSLLGGPGVFSIRPLSPAGPPSPAYIGDTLLLRTAWPGGPAVIDYLDCSSGRAFQRAGRSDLLRVIEPHECGPDTQVEILFAPRVDFGRVPTHLLVNGHGLQIDGGPEPCALVSPGVNWEIHDDGRHHTARATVRPAAGPVTLELRFGSANASPFKVPEADRRSHTTRFWSGWAGSLKVPPIARDAVVRSALILKALSHGPTGAIAAAATTSLPEWIGGVRNWDYRYCWIRDAAMSAQALLRLGNIGHAMRLVDWLVGMLDRIHSPESLRPLYTVSGHELGAEAEIGELPGYAGSRPVRVGNAASMQLQLDVFGAVATLIASMTDAGVPVSPDAWRLVRSMVSAVEQRWAEPDHGIWEIRGAKRHHVHSRVMCWSTVDRALIAHEAVLGVTNKDWAALRDRIAADVFANGWSPRRNSFVGYYGGHEPDAAVLAIGLCGMLPISDPRWLATVTAVETHLVRSGPGGVGVYRYFSEDGVPGVEGSFILCLGWLIEALATLGRRDQARKYFDHLLAMMGPTGTLAEEWDEQTGVALGNIPQAYSHLAVINAAAQISAI